MPSIADPNVAAEQEADMALKVAEAVAEEVAEAKRAISLMALTCPIRIGAFQLRNGRH
jgi:hypothetical protein